jgi:hypothetical protein
MNEQELIDKAELLDLVSKAITEAVYFMLENSEIYINTEVMYEL